VSPIHKVSQPSMYVTQFIIHFGNDYTNLQQSSVYFNFEVGKLHGVGV